MFDKDQKSIYVLAEKVMTGDPGRGGGVKKQNLKRRAELFGRS